MSSTRYIQKRNTGKKYQKPLITKTINNEQRRLFRMFKIIRPVQPSEHWVLHRYNARVQVTVGANAVASAVFRANGIASPVVGSVTHRPAGFDQWHALYNRYTVFMGKCTCQVTTDEGDDPTTWVLNTMTEQTPITTLDNFTRLVENSYGKVKNLGISAGGPNTITLSNFFNAYDWDKTDPRDNLRLSADLGNQNIPDEVFYYHLNVVNSGGGEQYYTVNINIEYLTLWRDPRLAAFSPEPNE